MLKCPLCSYVTKQRYAIFRLAKMLDHYQEKHITGNRLYAFEKMQKDLLGRKRAASGA